MILLFWPAERRGMLLSAMSTSVRVHRHWQACKQTRLAGWFQRPSEDMGISLMEKEQESEDSASVFFLESLHMILVDSATYQGSWDRWWSKIRKVGGHRKLSERQRHFLEICVLKVTSELLLQSSSVKVVCNAEEMPCSYSLGGVSTPLTAC